MSSTAPEFNAKFWQEDFEDDAREDARLHVAQSSATTQKRYKRETTQQPVMGELAYMAHFACALLCITISVLAVLAVVSNSVSSPMRAEPQVVTAPVQLTSAPTFTFSPTSMPVTEQPTKHKNTNKPTLQPTEMLTYQIDDEHVEMWAKQAELKTQVRKGNAIGLPGNSPAEFNQKFREYVCDRAPNPPVLNAFPPRKYADKQTLDQFLQHIQQMRFAMLEYYHLAQYKSEDFYSTYAATNDLTVRRIGKFFRQKLARGAFKLTVAAMGTSVMSGQDNCRETTYGPLLQRQLEHMLAPWPQATVEVRTMGQNGDGPNYQAQMLCAPDSLGPQVDFVHLWYAMISPTDTQASRQAFVRRMLQRGAVHVHTLVTNKETPWCPKELLDQGVCTKVSNLLDNIDWTPKHFWGRVDNGLCHNYTREGYVGTLMQNWHFGPIGFEIHTDQVLMLYLDGLELALQALIENKPIQSKPFGEINIHSKPADCHKEENWWTKYTCERDNKMLEILCTGGLNPNWNAAFPLNSVTSTEAFPRVGANEWSYIRYKGPSTMRPYAKELAESDYKGREECTTFPDVGYVYSSTMMDKGTLQQRATEWLGLQFASVEQSLQLAKRMHVYVCTGKRDQKQAPMNKLGNFTVQVGINGKVLSRRDFSSPSEDCLLITANPVPVLKPSDVLGIQFISSTADAHQVTGGKKTVQIGFVVLVGEQTPKQPVVHMPDFIYFDETIAPSTVQMTATPTASPVEQQQDRAPSFVEEERAPSFVEEERAPSFVEEERAPSQDRAPSFAEEEEEEPSQQYDRAPSASGDE